MLLSRTPDDPPPQRPLRRVALVLACALMATLQSPGARADDLPPPRDFGAWIGWGLACGHLQQPESALRRDLPAVLRDGFGFAYGEADMDTLLSAAERAIRIHRVDDDQRDRQCAALAADREDYAALAAAFDAVAQTTPGSGPGPVPASAAQPVDAGVLAQVLSPAAMRRVATLPALADRPVAAALWLDAAAARGDADAAREREALTARLDADARAAVAARKGSWPDHAALAAAVRALGAADPAAAEALYRRYLQAVAPALEDTDPIRLGVVDALAAHLAATGRPAAALPLLEQVVAGLQAAFGTDHAAVAAALNNLAELHRTLGRYADAAPLYARALAILEAAAGAADPALAPVLNNLGNLAMAQGRLDDAEARFQRALAIRKAQGNPPELAASHNNLGALATRRGRYDVAETQYRRALTLLEGALGGDDPRVAGALNNLAQLYLLQDRRQDAEPLLRRSLAIREARLGPDHPDTGVTLGNLAQLHQDAGDLDQAEALLQRALDGARQRLGADHPRVATLLNNLAALHRRQGRPRDAEPLYRQAIAILEDRLGAEHLDIATALDNLGQLLLADDRPGDAEPLLRRALAIREAGLGAAHPDVAVVLNDLADAARRSGRLDVAHDAVRRAAAIQARWLAAQDGDAALRAQARRSVFVNQIDLLATLAGDTPEQKPDLVVESFIAGQHSRASRTAAAVGRMAARFAAGDDELAQQVRARQDAVRRWQAIDRQLVAALAQPAAARDAEAEATLRRDRDAAAAAIDALDRELAARFPAFATLTRPQPLALADAQRLLAADELLLAHVADAEASYLWAVRRDRARLYRVPLAAAELSDRVRRLRRGLDPGAGASLGSAKGFPADVAHALYAALLGPAVDLLAGARRLILVPDGALQSLPPAVLLTEPAPAPQRLADFAALPWLGTRYAVSVLPTVATLHALRGLAGRSRAPQPFVGFGDPLFGATSADRRGPELAQLFRQGVIADVSLLRRVPRLPETAGELKALAASLGADPGSVHLGAAATEDRVKAAALSAYRVVAFATHGLMAGELPGVAEPALLLTPPEVGSRRDDGLLTAGEIAGLRLDADLVILSACNTAATDGTPGAEGLSGLARAFFYAGSRALLVSHWPVLSDAAVAITTGMLRALATAPGRGRAEALRQALQAMLRSPQQPHFVHPAAWAPFVVVGEGGGDG
jgi:CHAT domain-containing protein/Tfp pilus assembly protein PilF